MSKIGILCTVKHANPMVSRESKGFKRPKGASWTLSYKKRPPSHLSGNEWDINK